MIHKYMSEHKVPDESCMPYQAKNMGCTADTVCRNCKPEGGCWAVDNYIGYGVRSFGSVKGEAAIMKELHARGPLACSFACDDDFMFNYTENVMKNDGVYVSSARTLLLMTLTILWKSQAGVRPLQESNIGWFVTAGALTGETEVGRTSKRVRLWPNMNAIGPNLSSTISERSCLG